MNLRTLGMNKITGRWNFVSFSNAILGLRENQLRVKLTFISRGVVYCALRRSIIPSHNRGLGVY